MQVKSPLQSPNLLTRSQSNPGLSSTSTLGLKGKRDPRERDARYSTPIQIISKFQGKFSISNIVTVAHGDAQRLASNLVEKRRRGKLLIVCQDRLVIEVIWATVPRPSRTRSTTTKASVILPLRGPGHAAALHATGLESEGIFPARLGEVSTWSPTVKPTVVSEPANAKVLIL